MVCTCKFNLVLMAMAWWAAVQHCKSMSMAEDQVCLVAMQSKQGRLVPGQLCVAEVQLLQLIDMARTACEDCYT